MVKNMKKYDYLIVGAGLFGCVFAERMTAAGARCLVVEKRNHVGGNMYTQNIEGINVHIYGAHIFHTADKMVWDYINKFAEFNNYINSPVAFYKDETYNLPFNMNTFNRLWGVRTPAEAKAKIDEQVAESGIGEPKNLEEQAIKMVGKDIYTKLIKGYTEKQWGKSATELPSFIIRRLPVRFTYDNNYFNDRFQGIPIGGYTQIAQKMLDKSDVRLSTDFFKHKTELTGIADKVVFTGALDEYFDYCLGELEYRSVRFDMQILNESNHQGNAVINYTDSQVPYTRVIEHKHFEQGTQAKTVISTEYSTNWNRNIEPYYPINDPKNDELSANYIAMAKAENLIIGGRLANYKYYDMDKIIASALTLASEQ